MGLKSLLWVLYAVCAGLLLADFALHRHAHFSFESLPGFYAVYGFMAYLGIVLSAKFLRRFIRREEAYYEKATVGPAHDEERIG